MNVSFAKIAMPRSGTLVVTVTDKGALSASAARLDTELGGFIKRAVATAKFQGRRGQTLSRMSPKAKGVTRIVLFGLGAPDAMTPVLAETAGGMLAAALLQAKDETVALMLDPLKDLGVSEEVLAAHIAIGAELRDYRFDKYQTKTDADAKPARIKLTVMTEAQAGYIARCMVGLRAKGARSIMVREEPEAKYNRALQSRLRDMVWDRVSDSWYKDGERITNNWPGTTWEYQRLLRRVNWEDYQLGS